MERRRWGMAPDEWGKARHRLEDLLGAVAAARSTVTYGEAAKVAFGGRFSARSGALMDLLGEVDDLSQLDHQVMIATLVVRADTGRPGEGYFAFASEALGCEISDRETFWRDKAEAVWEYYAAKGQPR